MLGNPAKARAIFERWMEWEPEDNAWGAFVKFEMRQEKPANARYCDILAVPCVATQKYKVEARVYVYGVEQSGSCTDAASGSFGTRTLFFVDMMPFLVVMEEEKDEEKLLPKIN